MNQHPFNQQTPAVRGSRRAGRARPQTAMPWPLLALVLVLHIAVGLLLSIFSPPFWVWPLAVAGLVLQVAILAGPTSMASFQGAGKIFSRLAIFVGTMMSVVALSIAVGYGGTANIDKIRLFGTSMAIFFINLGVLVLTALCSLLVAHIGDNLLASMSRARCGICILGFCFLGLFFGGVLGLAIAG